MVSTNTTYRQQTLYERYAKRPIDIIGATASLAIAAPAIAVIAAAIRINMGQPVIFRQERPGLNEQVFTLVKFRTMTNPHPGHEDSTRMDSHRLTRLGKFLRKTSLDELPQVWNILKGEMSFIGPRPLRVRYLPYYTDFERQRHLVRPGITGLAQINGRTTLDWNDRFKLDVQYVKNLTAWNDFRIAVGTLLAVIQRRDVQVRGTGAVTDFDQHRRADLAGHMGDHVYNPEED